MGPAGLPEWYDAVNPHAVNGSWSTPYQVRMDRALVRTTTFTRSKGRTGNEQEEEGVFVQVTTAISSSPLLLMSKSQVEPELMAFRGLSRSKNRDIRNAYFSSRKVRSTVPHARHDFRTYEAG